MIIKLFRKINNIEAIKFDGQNGEEIKKWIDNPAINVTFLSNFLLINTEYAEYNVKVGYYVLKNIDSIFIADQYDFDQDYEVIEYEKT
jgi:hypothetical protein